MGKLAAKYLAEERIWTQTKNKHPTQYFIASFWSLESRYLGEIMRNMQMTIENWIFGKMCVIFFTKVYANIFPHNTRLIDTIIASRQADADREIVNSN